MSVLNKSNKRRLVIDKTKRIVLMGLLVALGTVTSHLFWFPAGVARAFPVQHGINVIAGVLLGPGPAVLIAFVIGLLRNMLGLGTLLAFPGGMVGAFLAGWLYQRSASDIWAVAGEVIGTGLFGALLSFPIANLLMGTSAGAFAFIPAFAVSAIAGAVIAYLLLKTLRNYFKFN